MRIEGYAPIRDYAVIGDGRTSALVARDGSVDWLCLPDVDSPSVFAAIVDAQRGGSFELRPDEPFETQRRYLPGSNVLETTFTTASGSVRVTDALALTRETELTPLRELVRQVDGVGGSVSMRWSVEPRFDYARAVCRTRTRDGQAIFDHRRNAVALRAFDAGEIQHTDGKVSGTFVAEPGTRAILDLAHASRQPLVLPVKADAERSLAHTDAFWREWSARSTYGGPYADAVLRSALALKLLVFAPSGAIVAAPTSSLPECIGHERNWDYRYSWLRDSTWVLNALLGLGYEQESEAFLWWLMHASRLKQPELGVLYRVNGDHHVDETTLDHLDGYRGSRPVRTGNGAADQLQLDVYGIVLDAAWRFVDAGLELGRDTAKEVAQFADHVTEVWRKPDSGIWEPRLHPVHHTQSKAMCWLALDRASKLAERGAVPDRRDRWDPCARTIRETFERDGWSDELNSYIRAPELPEPDASLLTLSLLGCADAKGERMRGTIERVRSDLAQGPFVYRYRGEDGLGGHEGAFVACSFWLVDALARAGEIDEAERLMEDVLGHANDVGLFAEEIDPDSGDFLGNFPQGLSHLALVNAALSLREARA